MSESECLSNYRVPVNYNSGKIPINCNGEKMYIAGKFKGHAGVLCEEINKRFKEYIVLTMDKTIKDAIERCKEDSIEQNKFRFRLVYINLTKYSDEELNSHYENKTKEWDDWCDDVVLFYAHRHVLFDGKYIPIMQFTDENKKIVSKNELLKRDKERIEKSKKNK